MSRMYWQMPALRYNLKAWRVKILLSLDRAKMSKTACNPNSWTTISLVEDFYCPMSWPLLDSYLYFFFNHIYNLTNFFVKVKLYLGISESISKSWACTLCVSFLISLCKYCTWAERIERSDSLRERLSWSCHHARSFCSCSNFFIIPITYQRNAEKSRKTFNYFIARFNYWSPRLES